MKQLHWPAAAFWAALAGWLLSLWWFYPGFASFDTAHQWYQVRHGEFNDHHPPLLALLWSLSEPVLPGPGGPFLLQISLYWTALGIIAARLFRHPAAQLAGVLLVGLAPPLLGLLSHVWKDVALMAWLLLACALLVIERKEPVPTRSLLLLALLLLAGVGALRHNGLAAALPLTVYIAWRGLAMSPVPPLRLTAVASALFAGVVILAQLPSWHPRVERVQFWPTLALWDLAAVSITEQRMLIPESLHKQPLTVDDLARHFRPEVNVPLYTGDLLKISLMEAYTDEETAQLRQAWLSLPWQHPRAYLGHRLRLARIQLGLPGAGMPPPMAFMPGHSQLADNPPIHVPDLPLRTTVAAWMRQLDGSRWLAPWPWLLLSLALAAHFVRQRRQTPYAALGLALVASAWCYALPLLALAASAELRYLSASLAAIAVATMLACHRTPERDHVVRGA